MAHALARTRTRFRRTVIFVAFAGEELGLLGSRHFVGRLPTGVRRVAAMINLDMIGRARGRVMLRGGDGVPFRSPIRALQPLVGLKVSDFRDGYDAEGSDDASFARERVPTLAFFTGFHDDYHRPGDDWERIDARGAAEIAQFALAIAARVATD
jgi:Zn-dependent M28 family amino/carboxypeptidase